MKFEDVYKAQIANQQKMVDNGMYEHLDGVALPVDNVGMVTYHVQHLISEIGEVLEADRRWKNIRNSCYDYEEKKYEIADCFIVLMNIAMFSGIEPEELEQCISDKIAVVSDRIDAVSGE